MIELVIPVADVGGIDVNNIACHLRDQVLHLAPKFDLSHRAHTIGIETIDGSLSGAQLVGGDIQVLNDPAGHNVQRRPWINLNAAHFG